MGTYIVKPLRAFSRCINISIERLSQIGSETLSESQKNDDCEQFAVGFADNVVYVARGRNDVRASDVCLFSVNSSLLW